MDRKTGKTEIAEHRRTTLVHYSDDEIFIRSDRRPGRKTTYRFGWLCILG